MMTTGILDALMRLFAVFAAGRSSREAMLGRQAADRYLSGRLSFELTKTYLKHYDTALAELNKRAPDTNDERMLAKRKSKLSVRLLFLCDQIQGELEVTDRLIMFARLSELAKSTGTIDDADSFLNSVSSALLLNEQDALNIKQLVKCDSTEDVCDSPVFSISFPHEVDFQVVACNVSSDELFFIKNLGTGDLRLNGNPLVSLATTPMAQGSVLKNGSGHTVFFSDVLQMCSECDRDMAQIEFKGVDLSHYFSYPGEQALRPLSVHASSGDLIGIMGASGSGKSTLLNILNGSQKPTFGQVYLNGYSVHDEAAHTKGSIGHIAQQDVLISELSVWDNLKFSAQLSLANLDDTALEAQVEKTLRRLGLWDIRDLRVGSVMDKTISGGQRKRLNIGLELIREPDVLFVDEPTSGLSSRDSEHIMDILKELTLRGKVIFVVIHQPSSDIFKLFDQLLLMDVGGYPVYQGNPMECLSFLKEVSNQVVSKESICYECGTINPEEIFETIESCMVDEYGHLTENRRVSPIEWNDYYNMIQPHAVAGKISKEELPEQGRTPAWWRQFNVFWQRDFAAKKKNRQYVWMNLLQAPALALLLALFTRYQGGEHDYIYRESENLPQFLFISVIVSLFLGLSFSAEEIFRDRPTLRRERFLQLNWNAYLASKTAMMLGISALQSFLYAGIAVWTLEIPNALGMIFLTLFSLSSFSNLLGLNLSSAMKSAKNIYIIIPLLIIPQIIFGGAIIRFDRFNPIFTQVDRVPIIGNMMASRWGFESLAVHLTRENESDKPFVKLEDRLERSAWRRDFWYQSYRDLDSEQLRKEEWSKACLELESWGYDIEGLGTESDLRSMFKQVYREAFRQRDSLRTALAQNVDLKKLKDRHHNEALQDWVMQTDRNQRIAVSSRGLVQETAFIHQMPLGIQAWNAPYYVPEKQLGPYPFKTPAFNLLMLWTMTLALYFILANRLPERWSWGRRLD